MVGVKLSYFAWWCQIVLGVKLSAVSNCPPCMVGVKLSAVSNCPITKSKHYIFFMWAVSSMTRVETEELIYPVFTLVAEFGESLGLFMRFLLIFLWDNFLYIENVCAIFGAKNASYLEWISHQDFKYMPTRRRLYALIEHLWSDDGHSHTHTPIPLIDSAHLVGLAEWKADTVSVQRQQIVCQLTTKKQKGWSRNGFWIT